MERLIGLKNWSLSPQANHSVILYWGDEIYDQNMHCLRSSDLYFSTTYHKSVYEIIYKALGQ